MSISDKRWGRRVAKIASEFLLILVGVSAALALDAWWQGVDERAREEQYLEQLLADSRENERRLSDALDLERSQLSANRRVLAAVRSRAPIPPDSARAWRRERALHYADPRLLFGTMEALMATGDINLIRDAEVRTKAIAFSSQLHADMAEFNRWVDDLVQAGPALIDKVEAVIMAGGTVDEDPFVTAIAEARDDPAVRGALLRMELSTQYRILYLERMASALRDFLPILEGAVSPAR